MAPVLSASLKQGTHSYIHEVTYCFTNCLEITASFWKGIAPKPTSAVICNSKHLYEEVGNVCFSPLQGVYVRKGNKPRVTQQMQPQSKTSEDILVSVSWNKLPMR